MNELKLWQRIAEHQGKVPGLTVTMHDLSRNDISSGYEWYVSIKGKGADSCHNKCAPRRIRATLMIAVDAIEAAGLAHFQRQITKAKNYYWQSYDAVTGEFRIPPGFNDQEHLALLECVALTLEALPWPKVAEWQDASGNGRTLSQPDDNLQPTLRKRPISEPKAKEETQAGASQEGSAGCGKDGGL
jgi:hypothetical protein